MIDLVNAIVGNIESTFMHGALIAVAAMSVVVVGYFLLVKTGDLISSNRHAKSSAYAFPVHEHVEGVLHRTRGSNFS